MIHNKRITLYYKLMIGTYLAMALAMMGREFYDFGTNPLHTKDFANYWIAAKVVFEGDIQTLFYQPQFMDNLREEFGPNYPGHNWSYPPHFLLFIWPLYFLKYLIAIPVFLLATLIIFVLGTSLYVRNHYTEVGSAEAGWKNDTFRLLVLAAILCNVVFVQNGFITSGFFLLALAFWEKKPIVAGLFLGLLTIKPQLGVLIPLLLLIDRNWIAIFSATLTTLALVMLSAMIFGVDAWLNYLNVVVPYQTLVMTVFGEGQAYIPMMLSGFMGARNFGINGSPAWAIHAMFAIPAFFLFLKVRLETPEKPIHLTALVIATFLITPYAFNYDGGVLAVVCILCGLHFRKQYEISSAASEHEKAEFLYFRSLIFFAASTLPVLGHILSMFMVPMVSPIILLACLFTLTRKSEYFYSFAKIFFRDFKENRKPVHASSMKQGSASN